MQGLPALPNKIEEDKQYPEPYKKHAKHVSITGLRMRMLEPCAMVSATGCISGYLGVNKVFIESLIIGYLENQQTMPPYRM